MSGTPKLTCEDLGLSSGFPLESTPPLDYEVTPSKVEKLETCLTDSKGKVTRHYKNPKIIKIDGQNKNGYLQDPDQEKKKDRYDLNDDSWALINYSTSNLTCSTSPIGRGEPPSKKIVCRVEGSEGKQQIYASDSHEILNKPCSTQGPDNYQREPIAVTRQLPAKTIVDLVEKLSGQDNAKSSILWCVSEPNSKNGYRRDLHLKPVDLSNLETYKAWLNTLEEGPIKEGLKKFIEPVILQKTQLHESVGWWEPLKKALPQLFIGALIGLITTWYLVKSNKRMMDKDKVDPKTFLVDYTADAQKEGYSKLVESKRSEGVMEHMDRSTKSDNETRHLFVMEEDGLDKSESGGIGKSEHIKKWAHRVVNGQVAHLGEGYGFMVFDVQQFAKGGKFVGALDEATTALDEAVQKNPKMIIYVKEAHLLKGLGSASIGDGEVSADFVERLLTRMKAETGVEYYKDVIFVFDTNKSEKLLSDGAFERRVNKVKIAPPDNAEAGKIVEAREYAKLPQNLQIKGHILAELIELAPAIKGGGNPARAIDAFQDFKNWLIDQKISGEITTDHLLQYVAESWKVSVEEVNKVRDHISLLKKANFSEREIANFLKGMKRKNENREEMSPEAIRNFLKMAEELKQQGVPEEEVLKRLSLNQNETSQAKAPEAKNAPTPEIRQELERRVSEILGPDFPDRATVIRYLVDAYEHRSRIEQASLPLEDFVAEALDPDRAQKGLVRTNNPAAATSASLQNSTDTKYSGLEDILDHTVEDSVLEALRLQNPNLAEVMESELGQIRKIRDLVDQLDAQVVKSVKDQFAEEGRSISESHEKAFVAFATEGVRAKAHEFRETAIEMADLMQARLKRAQAEARKGASKGSGSDDDKDKNERSPTVTRRGRL